MPSSHFNFLAHVDFWGFFFGCWIGIILRNNFFTFVCSIGSCIFSSLVHKFHIDAAICLVLDVYDMHVCIVSTSNHHAWVGWYLKIKLIKNIFRLIHLAQLFLKILCDIEELAWLSLVSNIPNLKTKIISSIDVIIVSRWKFGSRYRIDNISEEMLSRRIFLNHKFGRAFIELRRYSEIT
jgi:hypothetical protein